MISAYRVVRKFSALNQWGPKKPALKQIRDREKEIKKELETVKRLEKAQKELEEAVSKLGQADPNDNPQQLFNQVRPLLVRMGIANMVDRPRTRILSGRVRNGNQFYELTLKRDSILNEDIIARIFRNRENFDSIQWSPHSIIVSVWWPLEVPEER